MIPRESLENTSALATNLHPHKVSTLSQKISIFSPC